MNFSDFKPGDNQAITQLFKLYKAEFIGWAQKKWKHETTEALTLWIDTVLVFRRKVWRGDTFEDRATLKTYLFGVATLINKKNRFLWNKQQSLVQFVDDMTKFRFVNFIFDEKEEEMFLINDRVDKLMKALNELGENCKEILLHADIHQWSMERIAQHLGYKNANVVKTRKYKCKKQLMKLR